MVRNVSLITSGRKSETPCPNEAPLSPNQNMENYCGYCRRESKTEVRKDGKTYIPRGPDFRCPRLTRSATEPLLSCCRVLMMTCLAIAAKNATPKQKPAMEFSPMFFLICMKRWNKRVFVVQR